MAGAATTIKGGILGSIIVHGAPAVAGHLLGGEMGALAGLFGSSTIGAARTAGFRKIEDLVDRALLDPQFAKALAMKAPAKSQAADAALRFQFGRIGRATALGLAAGQSRPSGQASSQAGPAMPRPVAQRQPAPPAATGSRPAPGLLDRFLAPGAAM